MGCGWGERSGDSLSVVNAFQAWRRYFLCRKYFSRTCWKWDISTSPLTALLFAAACPVVQCGLLHQGQ